MHRNRRSSKFLLKLEKTQRTYDSYESVWINWKEIWLDQYCFDSVEFFIFLYIGKYNGLEP